MKYNVRQETYVYKKNKNMSLAITAVNLINISRLLDTSSNK